MPGCARAVTIFLALCTSLTCLGTFSGCGSTRSPGPGWVDAEASYAGPEVQLGRSGEFHAIRVMAPTGGWSLEGDRVELGSLSGFAYLTLRRPDPNGAQTQAIEELDVAIGVPASQGLVVYIRVIDFDERPESTPYRVVESASAG